MYQTKEITIAGLKIQSAYIWTDDSCYVTLSSVADALGVKRQSLKDWSIRVVNLLKNSKYIEVTSGIRKTKTRAYPTGIVNEFIKYRAYRMNDEKCLALVDSIVIADIERTIRETHGVKVSSEQHELNRSRIREDILTKYMDKYFTNTKNHERPYWLQFTDVVETQLTKEDSKLNYAVACELAYIAGKKLKMSKRISKDEREDCKAGIEVVTQRLVKMLEGVKTQQEVLEMIENNTNHTLKN